jgi:hypothetical protein
VSAAAVLLLLHLLPPVSLLINELRCIPASTTVFCWVAKSQSKCCCCAIVRCQQAAFAAASIAPCFVAG